MNAIDTNILVYAIDCDEPVKGQVASDLLDRLSAADTVLLWQVLCEFGAVLDKMHRRGLAKEEAIEALDACRERFPLVLPDLEVFSTGLAIRSKHGLSYWDALLVSACVHAGVTALYSEDLQSAPNIAGVQIVNPFVPPQ